jgi:hypothetical protein
MNVRDLLVDQSDDVFARTSRRLAGLTTTNSCGSRRRTSRSGSDVAVIGGAFAV